jgi:hypothetical protein
MSVAAPFVHAQQARKTLQFVAEADLKVFDPVWTTGYITRNHSYLIYDTLFGIDETLQIKPQMEWVQPTALRKNVRDVVKFGARVFWNVKIS